ncbi:MULTISPECIES: 16S rRNA (cytosine(1402)-N(4))-methyltransferase RsmH [Acidithrix]|uniref:Ribosomal RNA small subunit methyltransferase H n=1 Tax=Acidithrix ferrooxidans TaxID=1280514 RepID=A0A0D8HMQ2_9ACTN|nr:MULTISPECIES: 16S rRNA (cytosine(1402)-N(4))-methyltransferase RsmH [Acidithrix]KJF19037.1 ribosomal RNA small subunit methyltransferase H [Acidithrix ferrooxidans]
MQHPNFEFAPGEFSSSYHAPVMWREVVEIFGDLGGTVLDGTLGGGGHSHSILANLAAMRVIGIDRDQDAIDFSIARLSAFEGRFLSFKAPFSKLADLLRGAEAESFMAESPLVGGLFDFGVSSHQFDSAERGFSLRLDGALDMRMDRDSQLDAIGVLSNISENQLADAIRANGEGRYAKALARAIKMEIRAGLSSTFELSELIDRVLPKGYTKGRRDSQARVFQAIRVLVNVEMEELSSLLENIPEVFPVGSHVVFISYHSGEDAKVKSFISLMLKGDCHCLAQLGCVCGAVARARSIVRLATAKEDEVAINPRSRSAKMRAIEFIEPIAISTIKGRSK